MAGVGKVQLDNLPRRERRGGLCVTEREGIRLQMAAERVAVGWMMEI